MASPLKTPLGFNPIPASPAAPVYAEPAPSGLVDHVKGAFASVNKFRDNLNLPNPGTYEGVNREVKRKENHLLLLFCSLENKQKKQPDRGSGIGDRDLQLNPLHRKKKD